MGKKLEQRNVKFDECEDRQVEDVMEWTGKGFQQLVRGFFKEKHQKIQEAIRRASDPESPIRSIPVEFEVEKKIKFDFKNSEEKPARREEGSE